MTKITKTGEKVDYCYECPFYRADGFGTCSCEIFEFPPIIENIFVIAEFCPLEEVKE